MIVTFSVSNYRSFAAEETLSLVASKRFATQHADHTAPIPDSDERVLRTAVLYGANGAGKSNLFKALRYLRLLARTPRTKGSGTGREAFRFGNYGQSPSQFDLQFITNGALYRFGVKVDDDRVVEEWLVRVSGGREKALYERVIDETGDVKVDASGLQGVGTKLRDLAKVGGLQNNTFLATLQANVEAPEEFGEELRAILSWFRRDLRLISPRQTRSIRALARDLAKDAELLAFAGDFLRSASTGVDRLQVEKQPITETELRPLLSESAAATLFRPLSDGTARTWPLRDGSELLIEGNSGNHYYRVRVEAGHLDNAGRVIPLELEEESDGTQRLLYLIPALHQLRKRGAVFVIDEIDRSLHPMLVRSFLQSFLSLCKGAERQIIVTTHESSLLDQDLLRRDEIWFAEKDHSGATRLYSLTDFNVRKDLEIRKHYLHGRFGAIPFLGGISRLLETDGPDE
jgi:hypothetical protein